MNETIALVDDDRNILTSVTMALQAEGFEVDTYTDGKEALEGLARKPVDLAVLDIKMPRMDGMELLRVIKKDELLRTVPVVVTSVEGSRSRVNAFLENGAAGYIKKPFTPEEARDKLNNVLGVNQYGEEPPDGGDENLDF